MALPVESKGIKKSTKVPYSFYLSPKYMRILLASIYPYAFLLLYLTIPFDEYVRALPNILIGVLVVAFPLVVRKEDFSKLKRFPIYLFLGFFGYLVLNALFFGRLETDSNVLMKVLLALGLVILYLPVQGISKISKAIMYSSVAAILFSVFLKRSIK